MWVQPETTQKLYVALWAAFLASCFFPYRLLGLAVGKDAPLLWLGAAGTGGMQHQGGLAPACPTRLPEAAQSGVLPGSQPPARPGLPSPAPRPWLSLGRRTLGRNEAHQKPANRVVVAGVGLPRARGAGGLGCRPPRQSAAAWGLAQVFLHVCLGA